MQFEIVEEPIAELADQARISIAFDVNRVFDVSDDHVLTEHVLAIPYRKDYDEQHDAGPAQWSRDFDVAHWGWITARSEGRRIGGAVVAFRTPDVFMLEGRDDLAVLWDIRVDPEFRGSGVGAALFRAVERWAKARGCRELKIETQNVNVDACHFYQRQGCELRGVNRFAYPDLPDEIQLLWHKELARG